MIPIPRFYSPYAGPPSELADQSWHDLLQNMNLRVTREEISKSNQTSIILPDGGGYLAWIGAHHELHCIVSLHTQNCVSNGTDTPRENDSQVGIQRILLSQSHS